MNLVSTWSVVCVLVLVISSNAAQGTNPSREFKEHTRSVVKLKLQHGRTKREITSTEDTTGSHHREVTITMSTGSEESELELRLNEGLIPRGHSLSYQHNGQMRVYVPEKEESELCQYSGHVRGEPASWVAVSTCRGLSGVIFDGRRLRHIEPKHDDINAEHFLYTHEPLKEQRGPYEDTTPRHPKLMLLNQTPKSRVIKEPYGADEKSRYLELVLVVDHEGYLASGSDLKAIHLKMKNVANVLNTLFASLNIFITLVGVEVWTENDKIKMKGEDGSYSKKYYNFKEYRTEIVKRIPNDSTFLITWAPFDEERLLGVSGRGTICSRDTSGGVVTSDHGKFETGYLALVIAHEIGHTLGMYHDKKTCTCPDVKCIMGDTAPNPLQCSKGLQWSSCSKEYLKISYEKGMDHCLRNKPQSLFSSATCGNGFVEDGEQCDCGVKFGQLSPKMFAACTASCNLDCTFKDRGSNPTNATASTPQAANNSRPQTVNTSTSHPMTPSIPQSSQTVTPTTPKSVTPSTSRTVTPSTSRTVTPSTSRTVTPSTSQAVNTSTSNPMTPSIPQSSQTVTPTTPKAVTPSTSRTVTPSTSQAVNSSRSHPMTPSIPQSSQSVTTTTPKAVTPSTSRTVTPSTSRTVTPSTSQAVNSSRSLPETPYSYYSSSHSPPYSSSYTSSHSSSYSKSSSYSSSYTFSHSSSYSNSSSYSSEYSSLFPSSYSSKYSSLFPSSYSSNYSFLFPSSYSSKYLSLFPSSYSSNYSSLFPSSYSSKYSSLFPSSYSSNYSSLFPSSYSSDYSSLFPSSYSSKYSSLFPSSYSSKYSSLFPSSYSSKYSSLFPSSYSSKYSSSFPSSY